MKATILLICLALISCYNRDKAYNYAKKWWNDFNLKKYANYNPVGGDCANFVSQCLIAGGLDLVKMCGSSAAWGKGGTIPGVSAMASCFKKSIGKSLPLYHLTSQKEMSFYTQVMQSLLFPDILM